MSDVLQWRKRRRLTQVEAASLLGVSQPYLSLLEKGARPITAALRARLKNTRDAAGVDRSAGTQMDDRFRGELNSLGYPGFAHLDKPRTAPPPDVLLIAVAARPNADARVVEALPWLVKTFEQQMDFDWLVRQAKLQNVTNRLGYILEIAGVDTPEGRRATGELERARLLMEDTLCWDAMPEATREWMRANRSPRAAHWNLLTRLTPEDRFHAL